MSNTLLPMELETAMSPIPKQKDRDGVIKQQKQREQPEKKGTQAQQGRESEWETGRCALGVAGQR